MIPQEWLPVLLLVGSTAVVAALPPQATDESLKSVLDAISRKQRSLDTNSQEYYNDLRSFKYHGGESERKFDRDRQGDREIDEGDEEIEFLPNDNGQLETVGNGFQDLNNKLLERALIDYLENIPQQEEPVTSLFRERERSSSRKRGSGSDRLNVDNKDLAKLFVEALQDRLPPNLGDVEDDGYVDDRQMLYDRYRGDRTNKPYENTGQMSWGELLNKESMVRGGQGRETNENDITDREQDPNVLCLSLGKRRTVNDGYPMGQSTKIYKIMSKRFPVTKRSPKSMAAKKQATDPKVAQDLGVLFGTQSTDNKENYTHNHNHEHDVSHDHEHNHDHGDQHKHESSSEAPKMTPPPKGQKENATKQDKSKTIELRKKSVGWSQYFGIDRRRKKATLMAGQGTQNQDDEWMLQRYYENMAENLRANDREYEKEPTESKDKLDQQDIEQRIIKDMIIEEALKNADTEGSIDLQKVKDKVMTRMAAAYSFELMKALNDLRNNVAVRMKAQKTVHPQSNQTSNFRENSNTPRIKDKRTNNLIETDGMEENRAACPELEAIEKRCKTADSLAGDESQILYMPCVMLQICKACVQDDLECLGNYVMEAEKICNAQELRGQKGRESCDSATVILSRLQPPAAVSVQCRLDGNESCLRHYHYRYLHRYFRYPYGGRQNNVYDMMDTQQSDR
ncbi:hypothetical protein ANTRET_LOCUS6098 [Anthophora retusa]